jgi:hypothetical protein
MFTKGESKSASKDRTCVSVEVIISQHQDYSPRPRGEYLPWQALSLGWVLARSPALGGPNLPWTTIIGIAGRG